MAPTSDAKPTQRVPVRDLAGAVALIIAGCVTNNLALELVVSPKRNPFADPGAGSLLTLLQFILIAVLTLPHACEWRPGSTFPRLAQTRVPLRHYGGMTLLFFAMSFLNNAAFAFNISQPLHMVFRSSSLVVTYVVGYVGFGKR
jgi:solute carrier family 35 (UDP-xylose/UDP-N-acetylglucosamine transporter), member B4